MQFREAACWAHLRRDFHDSWTTTNSRIARKALDRSGTLHDTERDIAGQPAELRLAARGKWTKPKLAAFRVTEPVQGAADAPGLCWSETGVFPITS